MMGYLLRPYMLACVLIIVVGVVYYRRRPKSTLPDLPWLNIREGEWCPALRARIRSTFNYKETIHHAYQEVCHSSVPGPGRLHLTTSSTRKRTNRVSSPN